MKLGKEKKNILLLKNKLSDILLFLLLSLAGKLTLFNYSSVNRYILFIIIFMVEHHCLLKWSLISKTQKIQRYFLADTIQKATRRKSNVPVKSRNEFRWEHWVSFIGVMREKVTRNIVNWNKHPPDCKGSLHNWATFVAARKDFEKGDKLYRERERNNLSSRIRFEA